MNIKLKIAVSLLSSCLLIACGDSNKNSQPLQEGSKSFTITGKLKNAEPKFISLRGLNIEDSRWIMIDSVKPDEKGNYVLNAKDVNPDFFVLIIQDSLQQSVIADNAEIEFSADVKKFAQTKVFKGSQANQSLLMYEASIKKNTDAIKEISLKANALVSQGKMDELAPFQAIFEKESAKIKVVAKKFILENSPSLSIFTMLEQFNFEKDYNFLDSLIQKLKVELPNSKYTKIMLDQFDKAKKMKELSMAGPIATGKVAPSFELPTPDGKMIRLETFKGKYLLIDFWASWCKPCRAENPRVIGLYNKYKSKNFDILGVSLDENLDSWKQAIIDDGLLWSQVSDLKAWESVVVPLYGIQAIPFTCLLNPEGNIVAVNLRGEALESKLEVLLK